jgi:hypothetical protein
MAERIERYAVFLGPVATVVYIAFGALAWLAYPTSFGPTNNNWLSDLGNRNLNPNGADFYVWGCVLLGILSLCFFGGLSVWRRTGSRVQAFLLFFVQLTGALGAISIIMSAVYTEDQFAAHQFWSRLINACFAVALFVSPFAFRRRSERLWPLIAVSVLGYTSIVVRLVFADAHWLEWPSVGFLLIYVWVVASMSNARGPRVRSTLVGSGQGVRHPSSAGR